MSFKEIFKNILVILIITIFCEIFDFAMVFFDHRFTVGVAMGIIFYTPIKNWLSNRKFIK